MSAEFKFSVPINDLSEFNSPEFDAGGVPWKVKIIRKISSEKCPENDVIHVSLSCDYKASRQIWTGWWIDATAIVTLKSNKGHSLQKTISQTRFKTAHSMVEITDFISWKDLTTEDNDFIENGHFWLQLNLSSRHVQKRIKFCEEKNQNIEIEPEFGAVQNGTFQWKKGRTKRK